MSAAVRARTLSVVGCVVVVVGVSIRTSLPYFALVVLLLASKAAAKQTSVVLPFVSGRVGRRRQDFSLSTVERDPHRRSHRAKDLIFPGHG